MYSHYFKYHICEGVRRYADLDREAEKRRERQDKIYSSTTYWVGKSSVQFA